MFKKVLIADDLISINHGVEMVLKSLETPKIVQAQYCDDVILQIKKANSDEEPFDLIITDLSFKPDHREQKYNSGLELVEAINKEFPKLKTIVYSVEDRLQKVRVLINVHCANAYVCKGRRGLIELEEAILAVYNNEIYLSPQVSQALSPKSNLEISDFDIELMRLISEGKSQESISNYFKAKNITPNSQSSIEKSINRLRTQFKANNATQLVIIAKDLGLI